MKAPHQESRTQPRSAQTMRRLARYVEREQGGAGLSALVDHPRDYTITPSNRALMRRSGMRQKALARSYLTHPSAPHSAQKRGRYCACSRLVTSAVQHPWGRGERSLKWARALTRSLRAVPHSNKAVRGYQKPPRSRETNWWMLRYRRGR